MAEELTREQAEGLYSEMSNADLQAELGERDLPKTGNKQELVARLLDADFPPPLVEDVAPAETPTAPEDETPADPPAEDPDVEDEDEDEAGALCLACWPDGWPTPDTNNASCEHGVWDR